MPKGVEVQVLSGAPVDTLHEPARIEPETSEKLELTAAEAAGA